MTFNAERWQEVLELLEKRFKVLERYTEDLPDESDWEVPHARAEREVVVFEGPLGRMKLECTKKPLVVGRKLVSHRRKSGSRIQYQLSPTDLSYHLKAFKFEPLQQEWVEVEGEVLT